MSSQLKYSFIKNLFVGQVLSVNVAHVFENGYWSNYTTHDYIIESISKRVIKLRNKDHSTERFEINRKDLNSGFTVINYQP